MKILSRLAITLLILVSSGASPLLAHSFPEQETPAAGQSVANAPSEVVLKFDAPIEKLFAKLDVLNIGGQKVSEGVPAISDDGYRLSVKLGKLAPGKYTVHWEVVCVDSHHTNGSYQFTVAGSAQ